MLLLTKLRSGKLRSGLEVKESSFGGSEAGQGEGGEILEFSKVGGWSTQPPVFSK